MKKTGFSYNLLVVTAAHILTIAFVLSFAGIRSCSSRRQPAEIHPLAVSLVVETAFESAEANLEPEVTPEPTPAPLPAPPREPQQTRPRLIKRSPPPRQVPKVSDVERILRAGVVSSSSSESAPINDFTYQEIVKQTFKDAWLQPSYSDVGSATATAEIQLSSNGTVEHRAMITGSGNHLLDQSVMQALNAVKRVPGLPADFISRHGPFTMTFKVER